ncbi:type II secretion system minor pseudopilin GspH [Aliagarivorans taiwanensis]|uniref:type II secretion system minor pseudopilin GspH n=1 Tax=Aliagarivorans taiwanensis TaxID=561966 RepID=UPI0003F61B4F|nr:type II secretion system minor pseudopilin GspH [Aliagarivorans taiwanensis]
MRTRLPKCQQGFTLLEIILVCVMMAVAVSVAVMNISTSNDSKDMEIQVKRLAALLQFAQEQALMTGRDYGLISDEISYQFLELEGDNWQPATDEMFRRRELQEPYTLELSLGDWQQDSDGYVSQSLGLFEGGLLEQDFITADDEKKIQPQVMILSSGEVTPFSLTVEHEDLDLIWSVRSDDLGQIEVYPGEPEQ